MKQGNQRGVLVTKAVLGLKNLRGTLYGPSEMRGCPQIMLSWMRGEGQKLQQQQKVMHFINAPFEGMGSLWTPKSHNIIYEQPLVFCSMIGSEVTVK